MVAVYAGSFDPVTPGHVDVAKRAATVDTGVGANDFGRVVVVVAVNTWKRPRFSTHQRVFMLRSAFSTDSRISVDECHTVLASWARSVGATTLIRGSRCWLETVRERLMAAINFVLGKGLPTRVYQASPALRHCSSSGWRANAVCAAIRAPQYHLASGAIFERPECPSLQHGVAP